MGRVTIVEKEGSPVQGAEQAEPPGPRPGTVHRCVWPAEEASGTPAHVIAESIPEWVEEPTGGWNVICVFCLGSELDTPVRL